MAKYVEAFVVPVPKKNLTKYRKIAKLFGKVSRDHGALEYHEALADNLKKGKTTSFPRSVKLKADETVIFGWIVYQSRAQRNSVYKKIKQDPRLAILKNHKSLPFDGMRMFMGGFKPFLSLKK